MSIVESAAARMIDPLSALFQRPLCMVDPRSPEASHAFAVRSTSPRLCIVSADGSPFSDTERKLLSELFDVLRAAHDSEARYHEIETRLLAMQRENVELSVRNRELSEVASRDALTGLFNRSYVIEKLDAEMGRALRHQSPVALLMLDIDHFKEINDAHGHLIGDYVLQWVGRTLREACRVYDVPGRFGGEEFCVLLPETNPESTGLVAERIRQRLESSELQFGDATLHVTASIGVAGLDAKTSEEQVLNPAALVDRADRALYWAKNRGRNCVEVWESRLFAPDSDEKQH